MEIELASPVEKASFKEYVAACFSTILPKKIVAMKSLTIVKDQTGSWGFPSAIQTMQKVENYSQPFF